MDYEQRQQAILRREGWVEYRDSTRRRACEGHRSPERQTSRRTARRTNRGAKNRFLTTLLMLLTAAVLITAALRLLGGRSVSPEKVEEKLPDYVTRNFLTENQWSRPGLPLETVHGIVLHYVGNPGTTAQANRNYFDSLASGGTGVYASSHFIVGLDGEVIQCVPLNEIAYASNSRNNDTISIEVCHPDAGGQYNAAAYQRVVALAAWLCREFRLDPQTEFIRHYDVTGKLCPLYYVENPEAWDQLRGDVETALKAGG